MFLFKLGGLYLNLCENILAVAEFKIFINLFENSDEVLNLISKEFDVKFVKLSGGLQVNGSFDSVSFVKSIFKLILKVANFKKSISLNFVKGIIIFVKSGKFSSDYFNKRICLNSRKEVVLIKNFNQMLYLDAIEQNVITFGIGPAGTGKTYLAVAMAVQLLKNKIYNRIIFTRPVLEAGENLGFLPGSFQSKVDPFVRPLYDAMCEFVGIEQLHKFLERGIVEVLPLAYMRGRSLNDSFIVLDEAQNTTSGQMKMFLTRIGYNSKMVITGDLTQIDLPMKIKSGLSIANKILNGVENIAIINFEKSDVVRSNLVKTILEIYDCEF